MDLRMSYFGGCGLVSFEKNLQRLYSSTHPGARYAQSKDPI